MEKWWFDPPTGHFDKFNQLVQPTLILDGDRDPWFPVAAHTLLYDQIPEARLAILPAAGHAAHYQYPEIAAGTVLRFLNTKSRETK